MSAAMAPSGAHGRPSNAAPYNQQELDEYGGQGSSLDYDDGTTGGGIPPNAPNRKGSGRGAYDPRQIQGGYDARQVRTSAQAYYSDDQSYGGAATASEYGYSDGDQYYSDTPLPQQYPGGANQQVGGGYGMQAPMRGGGPPRPHPQQDGWYGTQPMPQQQQQQQQQPQSHQSRGGRGGIKFPNEYEENMHDPYGVTSFSEEEADELDSRLSRRGGPMAEDNRSKSLMRFNELERERSRRRQDIVKYKTNTTFPGTLKLQMMNTGLIPIKKGKQIKTKI